MMSIADARARYRESLDRATGWLLGRQGPDGSLRPVGAGLSAYYKAPLAFASRGELEAALRLLAWVKANALTPDGDLGGPYGRGAMAFNAAYPNAWVIAGAQKLGAYDVARPALRHLLTLQDETGGFWRVKPDAKPPGEVSAAGAYTGAIVPGTQDLLNASMAGHVCLATGLLDEARRAGDFLLRMLEAQPAARERIYVMWHAGHGLLTEFPPDNAMAFVIDARAETQNYFQLGISASFLARLYQATERSAYLQAAKTYLDLTENLAADRYSIGKAGKVGWGAAYVYRLTREPKYLDMSLAVGEALMGLQSDSGGWVGTRPEAAQVEVTAEFITLLHEMQEALA
jgi:hypothetical protein